MGSALEVFRTLPLSEQLFVRLRLFSAPLGALAQRISGTRVLDAGCGHGVLCALALEAHPERHVTGIDPDPRKIAWARASVGLRPNTEFEVATVEALAQRRPASFDTVLVADVLYLLDASAQRSFLEACRQLLVPGGRLLLKEAEADGGWRSWKALAQEQVMVKVLRRTRSSGGLGFSPREATIERLEHTGFVLTEVVSLKRWSTTPHVLFVAMAQAKPR